MKQLFTILLSASLLLMLSTACKKIATPNEESKEIFGSWNYISNSGGFAGTGGSTKYEPGSWVEFTEKGFMKYYEGSKKKFQQRFTIELIKSINYPNQLIIKYKNDDFEHFKIEGDNLYLSDTSYDGYIYTFTRK